MQKVSITRRSFLKVTTIAGAALAMGTGMSKSLQQEMALLSGQALP